MPSKERDLNSNEYKKWRKRVYSRDEFTCQLCGKKDVPLNAHHLIPWGQNRELRFVISNGITLCVRCHEDKVNGHEREFLELFQQKIAQRKPQYNDVVEKKIKRKWRPRNCRLRY